MPPHFGTKSYTRRNVRAAARRALRRTLTRTAGRILAAVPGAVLAAYLFVNRHLTLAELVSARFLVLAALAGPGALYEALTASNLFFRPRLNDMLRAIRQAEMPELAPQVPDCPRNLAEFFELELNADKSLRSQSGRDYCRRLERVRRSLGSESSGSVRLISPALIQPST